MPNVSLTFLEIHLDLLITHGLGSLSSGACAVHVLSSGWSTCGDVLATHARLRNNVIFAYIRQLSRAGVPETNCKALKQSFGLSFGHSAAVSSTWDAQSWLTLIAPIQVSSESKVTATGAQRQSHHLAGSRSCHWGSQLKMGEKL